MRNHVKRRKLITVLLLIVAILLIFKVSFREDLFSIGLSLIVAIPLAVLAIDDLISKK